MEEKLLTRRDREKIRQRNEILEVALNLFSEKGYHTVSMHEIAKNSDCAIGTVYSHFKNKEDLYGALIFEKVQKHQSYLKEVLSQNGDKVTVVRNYITAKGEIFVDSLAIFRLYFAEATGINFHVDAGLDQEVRWVYDELVLKLSSVLEQGIREKVFRPADPYYMALALEGIANTFLVRGLEDPVRYPYAENVPLIMDLFLSGCADERKRG